MDPLSIMVEISRGADKLYKIVQQKRRNLENARTLRQKIFALEQHISKHHGKGKDMKTKLTDDVFHWIVTDLQSIKLNMNAINIMARGMFSPYFKANEIKEQMDDMILMAELIKIRLEHVGMASDTVQNVTEVFDNRMTELTETLRTMSEMSLDKLLAVNKESLEILRKFVSLVEDQQKIVEKQDDVEITSTDGESYQTDDETSSSIDVDISEDREMDVFSRVPEAAMKVMEELTGRGGESEERSKLLKQVDALWSGWQVERSDLKIEEDKYGDDIQIGRGATSDVFSGFLKATDGSMFPVAIKSVLLRNVSIPDMLREVFLHLLAQHSAIVTLHGMWYPLDEPGRKAFIVVERMSCSVAEALRYNKEFDRELVLRDVASAVAHMHEKGIVHRDLKPGNILLNDDMTRAKLSDFGSSRRRSNHTITATTMRAGTMIYMAPEVLHNVRCRTSRAWDVWSFGIVMCELYNTAGQEAYVCNQHSDIHVAAVTWADGINDDYLHSLARWCLRAESNERPTMKVVSLYLDGVLTINDIPAIGNTSRSASMSAMRATGERTTGVRTALVSSDNGASHETALGGPNGGRTGTGVNEATEVTPMAGGTSESPTKIPNFGAGEQGQTSSSGGERTGKGGGARTSSADSVFSWSTQAMDSEQAGASGSGAHMAAAVRGEGQVIEEWGWGAFREVTNKYPSKRVDLLVDNRSGARVGVYTVVDEGRLRQISEIGAGVERAVRKPAPDGGVTMLLKDEVSQLLRAVVGVRGSDKKRIVITSDSLIFEGIFDWNDTLEGIDKWPISSIASGRSVEVAIRNDRWGALSVNKLDGHGSEEPFIGGIDFKSGWTGHADEWSVLVFRTDEKFLCATSVPDVAHFTVTLVPRKINIKLGTRLA